jgi:RNA recognition motif-containing protein
MSEKHDVFVGNMSIMTSEEQLREIFSTVGQVTGIRMVIDRETNRPKGFCFVEFSEASMALSAIRNLDGEEVNGRKMRVSFSNNSNLRDIAGTMPEPAPTSGAGGSGQSFQSQNHTAHLPLHDAYDVLVNMKKLVEEDRGHRAKELLEAHPELIGALKEILHRLGLPPNPSTR